jgi:hypothetical protein
MGQPVQAIRITLAIVAQRWVLGGGSSNAILARKGGSMYKLLSLFAIAALLASTSLRAQNGGTIRYKWHDAQGLSHFSDSLNVEAMRAGYDLVNDSGLVIRHVPRQLTVDERVAATKLAAAEASKNRTAKAIASAEAQMMAAYPTEEMYKISLQQELETIDQKIHTTQINLHSQERTLTDLLGRAADIESAKEKVSQTLSDSITKQRGIVTEQRNTLRRQQDLRLQTVQRQAQQLVRYQALEAKQDKGSR